jgi:hypothetical protein
VVSPQQQSSIHLRVMHLGFRKSDSRHSTLDGYEGAACCCELIAEGSDTCDAHVVALFCDLVTFCDMQQIPKRCPLSHWGRRLTDNSPFHFGQCAWQL